ncbi:hypothetical protein QN372_00955 [Undibacterium sp. RTI2.1]|uniref:hypothetical protein n=1 Tax=unclassified Undibacterium TaxID=2630295 RepID=UPI002B23B016|nr:MULTISPECIES: hypothetical protein [unclassified Undibacterium]MEB0029308.1 hypothetical protein [Undibacterium sp. RTI2.1]MEB0115616.1 hypothetical protein [Undibacterium sp. RTI2.2]
MKQPTSRQIISTFQGFFVLSIKTTAESDYPVDAYREPVIGWQIDDDSIHPIPLTPSGEDFQSLDILYPDGTVMNPFDCPYENFDSWLKAQQDNFNRRHGVSK